jgi:RNA polymerase sigma-32 factor
LVDRAMNAPLLTRAQEQDLVRRWHEGGDERALQELIAAHGRLAVSAASKFHGAAVPFDDLVQQGYVGLLKAAMRFEPSRDVRFSTYATWWVRAEIYDCMLRNWSMVRIGGSATQKALFFALRRLRSRLDETKSRDDLRQELAARHRVSAAEVEAMEQVALNQDLSLNAPLGEEGSSTRQDGLVDGGASPEDVVMFAHDNETRGLWLRAALKRLPERDQAIIRARHLGDERRTLDDLGRELGISKERVRQLEQRAIVTLRQIAVPERLSEMS